MEERLKHIPTGQAITELVNQWLNRLPPKGITKEISAPSSITKLGGLWSDDIKPMIDYTPYLLKHKWNVLGPALQLGLSPWRAVKHDWSKFKPNNFYQYAEYFNGPKGITGTKDPEVYQKWRNSVQNHYESELHHSFKLGLTPDVQTELEELSDWYSVGKTKAQLAGQLFPDFATWFKENKPKFVNKISPAALSIAEQKINEGKDWWNVFL